MLSGDEDALGAVLAGAWTGSNQMAIYEGVTQYGKGTKKPIVPGAELDCRLELDMDARTAVLTINGVTLIGAFTESLTRVTHIGFGVRNTQTLFSTPKVLK